MAEDILSNSGLAEAGTMVKAGAPKARPAAGKALTFAPSCELMTLPPRSVLVMRFRSTAADLPRGFFHRYESMLRYARQYGQQPVSPPFAFYDNIDGNAADVEAGIAIASDIDGSGDILVTHLPGMTVAALVHEGAYANIEASYFRLLEWMHEQGLARSGRFMETYLNSPLETPESRLLTQIMAPVGPRSANDE
jgi:effector-binding domain-containing protein